MWPHVAQVKRAFSVRGHEHSQIEIIISLSLHHLSKLQKAIIRFGRLILSLPLRDFGFSSPVIVIVKDILIF